MSKGNKRRKQFPGRGNGMNNILFYHATICNASWNICDTTHTSKVDGYNHEKQY